MFLISLSYFLTIVTRYNRAGAGEEMYLKVHDVIRNKYRIFVYATVYPVIPKGKVLFRFVCTCMHKQEDIDKTLQCFKDIRKIL